VVSLGPKDDRSPSDVVNFVIQPLAVVSQNSYHRIMAFRRSKTVDSERTTGVNERMEKTERSVRG
jgi:hypothetical protein